MTTATALKPSAPKQLPPPNSDFYQFADTLNAEERAILNKVRVFMETKVAPIITKYWIEDAFPVRTASGVQGAEPRRPRHAGLRMRAAEASCCSAWSRWRWRASIRRSRPSSASTTAWRWAPSTLGGSEEQKQKWLPPMARFEKIGCFGLTEPLVGSGAAGGLLTTAKREGDTWILNGQKRWIGNAPWCDVSIIWARDVADNQVKGFIVENKTTPGFSVEKIQNKIALKVVQNGQITLKDVRVPEANRLQNDNSFRDTAKVLR